MQGEGGDQGQHGLAVVPTQGEAKLGLGWTGPYRVEELIGRHTAKFKGQGREVIVHLDDLKPYLGEEHFPESDSEPDSDPEESEAELEKTDSEPDTTDSQDEGSGSDEEN